MSGKEIALLKKYLIEKLNIKEEFIRVHGDV